MVRKPAAMRRNDEGRRRKEGRQVGSCMSAVAVRNFSRCLEAMQSISEIIMGVFFKKGLVRQEHWREISFHRTKLRENEESRKGYLSTPEKK